MHRAQVVRALDLERVVLLLDQCVDRGGHVVDHGIEVEGLEEEVHLARLDLRQVENVVDQGEQMPAGAVNPLQVGNELLLLQVLGLFHEQLAVADDGVHGCAQLMAHVRQKGALGLVRRVGFLHRPSQRGGAFHHLLVQAPVELDELPVALYDIPAPSVGDPQDDQPACDQQWQRDRGGDELEQRSLLLRARGRERCVLELAAQALHAFGVGRLVLRVLLSGQDRPCLLQTTLADQIEGLLLEGDESLVRGIRLLRALHVGDERFGLLDGLAELGLEAPVASLPVGGTAGGCHPRGHRQDFVEVNDLPAQLLDSQAALRHDTESPVGVVGAPHGREQHGCRDEARGAEEPDGSAARLPAVGLACL